jgi:hypothetical protein
MSSLFRNRARFAWALAFLFASPPALAGGDPALTVGGEIKFDYFDKRTKAPDGKVENDSDSLIDEAILKFNAMFGNGPRATLVLATEKVGTSEYEPGFVKEFVLALRFDRNYEWVAGRMILPFGHFRTAVVTDPQTKQIGLTKTDVGLGVRSKDEAGGLAWNIVAFAGDYRTPGPGADGVTVNVTWEPAPGWTAGAGIINRQYARADSPALANVHAGLRDGAWELNGEYLAALDNEGSEKPRGLSVDGTFALAPKIQFGARLQTAARRFSADGPRLRYDDRALALKYTASAGITLGVEYLAGRKRGGSVEADTTGQITARAILSF